MSEALSDDAQNPHAHEPDPRLRASPPAQGMAPAWEPVDQTPPVQPPELERHIIEAARGLSFEKKDQPEVRSGISGTAERIGSAVGSAQRQVRRGLTLVSSRAAHLSQVERENLQRAASTMQGLGEEVAGIGQQAARRLDQWSADCGERLQRIRHEMASAPSRWRARGQQLAEQFPLQTIAIIAGISFAAGVALRLSRRSRRG
jgi:hypothetical protein